MRKDKKPKWLLEENWPLTPLGHMIMIHIDNYDTKVLRERKSAGGILLDTGMSNAEIERHQEGRTSGVVVFAGPDAWKDQLSRWAKVGDHVHFKRYAGELIKTKGGEMYRIMWDADIWALINDKCKDERKESVDHVK